jgi:hypothetical protein
MSTPTTTTSPASPAPRRRWHRQFLAMLPAIVTHAKYAFRRLHGEARQDAIQETIANALVAFVALVRRGKASIAYPSVLSKYAVRQIKDGRRVGSSLNAKEVLSAYAQRLKGFHVDRLDRHDKDDENAWCEVLVEDRHAGPAEIACTKIDFEEWLKSLPVRYRRLAQYLGLGNRTSDAAKKFKISAGRVSQVRRELAESWRKFVGDDDPGAAALAA